MAAVDIAAAFGSNLTGCYIAPSLRSLRGVDDEPTVMALLMDVPRDLADDHVAFARFATTRGVDRVSWMATRVAPAKTLWALGAWHDLVVIERDIAMDSVLSDVLGETLLTCRTACLVLPPRWDGPVHFKHLVIGWNGSVEAARAIHASLPIAMKAECVTVLTDRSLVDSLESEYALHFDPIKYLSAHSVIVRERSVGAKPRESGQLLLGEANRLSADLLVMGAYGRTRVRERMLGGATRHVLENAQIPVLMQH
jgi:nucleotide-binding universal stress UspA family protein